MNFSERALELRNQLKTTEWPEETQRAELLENHGNYLVARALGASSLPNAFIKAGQLRKVLLILPPSKPEEEIRLLRRLPTKPPEEARLALFSSGSTGEPKAVFHSEASLLASACQLGHAFPGVKTWACLLPSWGMAGIAFQFLLPLALGGGHVFTARESLLYWHERLDSLLADSGSELLVLNPFQHAAFLRGESANWKGTTLTLTTPMKAAQREQHLTTRAGPLREIYGMTEASGPVLLDGKSLGAELRLAGDGELELHGPQLCLGFGRDGAFETRPEWHPTGDIFEKRGQAWHFISRKRELIDVGGRKVAPKLIEEIFEAMPEIAECLAFPKLVQGIERPALLYVRRKSCRLSESELAGMIEKRARDSLSKDLQPAWWKESKELPRLPNGKPNRKSLV